MIGIHRQHVAQGVFRPVEIAVFLEQGMAQDHTRHQRPGETLLGFSEQVLGWLEFLAMWPCARRIALSTVPPGWRASSQINSSSLSHCFCSMASSPQLTSVGR